MSGRFLLGWSPRNLDLLVREVVPCIARAFCLDCLLSGDGGVGGMFW